MVHSQGLPQREQRRGADYSTAESVFGAAAAQQYVEVPDEAAARQYVEMSDATALAETAAALGVAEHGTYAALAEHMVDEEEEM